MIHNPQKLTAEERRERAKERARAEREQAERSAGGSSADAFLRMLARQNREPEPEKDVGRRSGSNHTEEARIRREQHQQYLADLRSGKNPFWSDGRRKLSSDGGRLPEEPDEEDEN